jgi:hypothetical protein
VMVRTRPVVSSRRPGANTASTGMDRSAYEPSAF